MTAGSVSPGSLPAGLRASLAAALGDLRHDLGKYITFETRFVEDRSDLGLLREALRLDLNETHRRGDTVQPAWEIWARLRPAPLEHCPEVEQIDGLLARLAEVDLDDPATNLASVAADAASVARLIRQLATRFGSED